MSLGAPEIQCLSGIRGPRFVLAAAATPADPSQCRRTLGEG
jgi:hypothetical protein